jgi:hypothetical protein
MATYSVGTNGYRPQNPYAIKTHVIPDATDSSISGAPFTAQQNVMRQGDSMLIKTQTGAIRRMKIDAERSTPGYIVLLPQ